MHVREPTINTQFFCSIQRHTLTHAKQHTTIQTPNIKERTGSLEHMSLDVHSWNMLEHVRASMT